MIGITLLLLAADGAAALPADVRRFVTRRDSCDHWRGEEPYDAARRREIERAIASDCAGTDRALARLRARHAGEPGVIAALAEYKTRIESHPNRSTSRKRRD